jgi:hypothetical protein
MELPGRRKHRLLYIIYAYPAVMISHRKGFDRYYDLRERVVPPEFHHIHPKLKLRIRCPQGYRYSNVMREKRFRRVEDAIGQEVSAKEAEANWLRWLRRISSARFKWKVRRMDGSYLPKTYPLSKH